MFQLGAENDYCKSLFSRKVEIQEIYFNHNAQSIPKIPPLLKKI